MNPKEVGLKIEQSQHAFVDARNMLASKHAWADNDARLTILNKCSRVLITINLGLVFMHQCLSKEQWWRAGSTQPIDIPLMIETAEDFERRGGRDHEGSG